MSDGYPTAAQKEALRLICDHGRLETGRLGHQLLQARRPSTNPGYAAAITRMAGTLTWRLHAQGFIIETADGAWETTASGRELISCASEHA
ncbi:hypothetical protein FH608_027655 [Nonomuraea phyllanthi]|uniref:Uncharacterized protein n=1 Tax=Nonomuraea phyllanthi TaxID=2219224 RepID=A0A5C4W5N9_9ACTN|nr:hypothetical protein [Nonomuraea phyllanthi]KAB8191752.1 hypothetical protein FH608_027655 [Nonomuraea phyllanthi]QFY10165.1 hypothetical protein GBF35_29155 [Nonomuraea phyllanthi]